MQEITIQEITKERMAWEDLVKDIKQIISLRPGGYLQPSERAILAANAELARLREAILYAMENPPASVFTHKDFIDELFRIAKIPIQ